MSEMNPVTYDDVNTPPAGPDDSTGSDGDRDGDDDLATLLRKREHARPNRVTWVLLTLLVLTAGFVVGAFANQKFGSAANSSRTATGFPAGFPSGFPGAFPGGAPLGGASTGQAVGGSATAGLANATVGTVKLIDGQNLYVTTTNGETVKVKVPAGTPVTSQKKVPLSDITAGATVIVRGEAGGDGTVSATSVSEGDLPGRATGSADTAVPAPTAAAPTPSTQGAN
jgi:hypothetical protein